MKKVILIIIVTCFNYNFAQQLNIPNDTIVKTYHKTYIKGIEINKTSIGISTISSPFKENINTIVNNNAINVNGEILGINISLYQVSPFNFIRINRVKIPIRNGIPK